MPIKLHHKIVNINNNIFNLNNKVDRDDALQTFSYPKKVLKKLNYEIATSKERIYFLYLYELGLYILI
jgi:hypothetical protein